MELIQRGEVMGIQDYEMVREPFRARVIQEKKARRVRLGEHASCVFENRDTVLMQIQEMLRTERITREAGVLHEIETYNELIPVDHELSATILLEIDDKETRERFLVLAKGLERTFAIVVGGAVCPGKIDPSREHPERTTAVHYVKFDLAEAAEASLRAVLAGTTKHGDLEVTLEARHPRYTEKTVLPPALVLSLAEDLA